MALQKTTQLPTGVTADYWRIVRMNVPVDGEAEIFLGLYVNQAARAANPQGMLDVKSFLFPLPKAQLISGNAFEYCYGQITASQKTPAVPAVMSEDGVTVLTPAIPEGPEQNWFADAVLC